MINAAVMVFCCRRGSLVGGWLTRLGGGSVVVYAGGGGVRLEGVFGRVVGVVVLYQWGGASWFGLGGGCGGGAG